MQMYAAKVYAVIGGIDYEGELFDTLRLFDCKSAADAYREELENEYDYAKMEIRDVDYTSVFCAACGTGTQNEHSIQNPVFLRSQPNRTR